MIRPDDIEPVARTIVMALAWGVAEAALLALFVVGVSRLARAGATTRHVLWWIVFAAAALLPAVSIATSLGHIERPAARDAGRVERPAGHGERPASRVAGASEGTGRVTSPRGGDGFSSRTDALREAADDLVAAADPVTSVWPGWRYAGSALLGLWGVVAFTGLGRVAAGLVALRRIKRAAVALAPHDVRRLRRWRYRSRTGRPATIAVSRAVDVPIAAGLGPALILLPESVFEHENAADIDQIAMHEYAHLERHDDWTNLAERIIASLLWFNPIVHWMARQIALEREIACDDWVVAQTGRAHRYATCLWKLVESTSLPARPIVAPGAFRSPKQITVRIERLLDSRRNALPRLSPLGALAIGALVVAGAVFQAAHAPHIALAAIPAPAAPATPANPATPAAPVTPSTASGPTVPEAPAALDRAALESCVGCDLHGRDLRGLDLRRIRLIGADLHGVDLRGVDMSDSVLTGVDLRRSRLDGANLQGARLNGVSLRDASLVGARLDGLRLTGTSIRGAAFGGTSLRSIVDGCMGCDLRGLDLHGQDLHGIRLAGADLREADLRHADLRGASLTGVDLRDAKLDGANLHGATLRGCDLAGVDRDREGLSGASLDPSDLQDKR
jgi:uncharacterized protein YjbI with pentapeptide repeats/beta-lactamase regulating signal transducer with metallopeptidase domain